MASRCPICRGPIAARAENPTFPFCSERCRLIDLGNWLGESYRVPIGSADEDEDGAAVGEDGDVAPRRSPDRLGS